MSLRRAVVVPLLVPVLLASAPAATAERPSDAARRDPVSVTVKGKGWGHGKGLSQYGARNRANAGAGSASILRFYYPGTTTAKTGGAMRVLITGDTTRDVVVRAQPGVKLHSLGARKTWRLPAKLHGKKINAWRIVAATGHRSRVQLHVRSWRDWRTARGDAEFTAPAPITLLTPAGPATYRGKLRSASTNDAGTARRTVNIVSLESYLRGVVPEEMPALWPSAALQAQAVAARTYAVYERRATPAGGYYDICDTTQCQVYRGYLKEAARSDAAIRATAGKVLMYRGAVAFTQFSASNGGFSAPSDFAYMRAAKDTFDHGYPGDPWTRTFTGPQITRNWPGLGDLVSVTVTDRDDSGRARTVEVQGSTSTVDVRGSDFASYLGLRSTLFDVS